MLDFMARIRKQLCSAFTSTCAAVMVSSGRSYNVCMLVVYLMRVYVAIFHPNTHYLDLISLPFSVNVGACACVRVFECVCVCVCVSGCVYGCVCVSDRDRPYI